MFFGRQSHSIAEHITSPNPKQLQTSSLKTHHLNPHSSLQRLLPFPLLLRNRLPLLQHITHHPRHPIRKPPTSTILSIPSVSPTHIPFIVSLNHNLLMLQQYPLISLSALDAQHSPVTLTSLATSMTVRCQDAGLVQKCEIVCA